MASIKQFKRMEKSVAQQQRVIADLNALAQDIDRSEKAIQNLQAELQAVNEKHQGRRTTREDIAYLTALLKCANKKLIWEKQIASLQKRTPLILEAVSRLMNDPQVPADDQLRAEMLRSLQAIQAAMERLQNVKST